jgi:hypothetical protein
MALDILIDPVTLDFVDTADGEWEETDDSRTAVMCQIESREGAWWGDASAGTRNAEIMESELPTLEALVDSTKRGLQALRAGGVISAAAVAELDSDNARGYGSLYLTWTDRKSTRPADLAYSPMERNPFERFGPNE